MATPPARASGAFGKRYWAIIVVVVILGLSLLFSFDFTSGQFGASAWSNLISGVQVGTLVVLVAFFLWWARSRDQ